MRTRKAPASSVSLVIVESPTKVATIQKILGAGHAVASTKGHFADIPERGDAVDTANGFAVRYRLTEKGAVVIAELRGLLAGASELVLATDADREGEMIAHLLVEFLEPTVPVRRVRFGAITPDAVREAMANPSSIDANLVEAARTRRVLDHLYGFRVSPELWSKVRSGLSAGRVQSPALRLVVERERERMDFVKASYCTIEMTSGTDPAFEANLRILNGTQIAGSGDFDEYGEIPRDMHAFDELHAGDLVTRLGAAPLIVTGIEQREYRRRAPLPYITSTLLQDALNRLGIGSRAAQAALNTLFAAGHITYPRTDSPHVAPQAVVAAREAAIRLFGEGSVPEKARHHRARNRNAQEAHEALRPTAMTRREVKSAGMNAARIYDLIWRRTVASQMRDATGTTTTVSMTTSAVGNLETCVFTASGTVIEVPGFRMVTGEEKTDPILPGLAVGDTVPVSGYGFTPHETRPPARYTEASLIKALEERGIGRPSTYAPIMASLRGRYVWSRRGDRALIPTITAFAVHQVMAQCFAALTHDGFTSTMEDRLTEIVEGKCGYVDVLSAFYMEGDGTWPALSALIEEGRDRFDPRVTPVMSFGVHPELGEEAVLRAGKAFKSRNGEWTPRPYLVCGNRTVPVPDETEMDTLTKSRVFDLLVQDRSPRSLGEHVGREVRIEFGVHGPFVRWGGEIARMPRDLDVLAASFERIRELLDNPPEPKVRSAAPGAGRKGARKTSAAKRPRKK
ncbi:MAG: topoisomerase [Actinomycetota bacterium]|jgi:DNA topoisomerase-1